MLRCVAQRQPRLQWFFQSKAVRQFTPLRQASTTAPLNDGDIYDIVVVGGGIAGLAFATSVGMQNLVPFLICSCLRLFQILENCSY